MDSDDKSFKLYSLNQARKLLGIGRAALESQIQQGAIGVLITPSGRYKIPHVELHRYIDHNLRRIKTNSIPSMTDRHEFAHLINGKRKINTALDSVKIFDKIMEKK
jgi:predicted site-specific integrase-resolvase